MKDLSNFTDSTKHSKKSILQWAKLPKQSSVSLYLVHVDLLVKGRTGVGAKRGSVVDRRHSCPARRNTQRVQHGFDNENPGALSTLIINSLCRVESDPRISILVFKPELVSRVSKP